MNEEQATMAKTLNVLLFWLSTGVLVISHILLFLASASNSISSSLSHTALSSCVNSFIELESWACKLRYFLSESFANVLIFMVAWCTLHSCKIEQTANLGKTEINLSVWSNKKLIWGRFKLYESKYRGRHRERTRLTPAFSPEHATFFPNPQCNTSGAELQWHSACLNVLGYMLCDQTYCKTFSTKIKVSLAEGRLLL